MSLVNKQKVQDILEAMFRRPTPDARLAALRELIARLNYEPLNEPLRVEIAADAEVEMQPVSVALLGHGGTDNAFHIIYTHLITPYLPRTAQRAVITRLLKDHPYALFIFANHDCTLWNLVNVKVAKAEASDENRDPKMRRLFRRITIGPLERLRTATERLELLDLEHIAGAAGDLFGLSPLAIQLQHEAAFDVEAVTDEFFKRYREIFETVKKSIIGLRGDESRTYYTQRLFNRLMFIAFIQKKGWLRFSSEAAGLVDASPADYLYTLWADYQAKKKDDSNFYADRLRRLFFHALNTPNETNQTGIRGTGPHKTLLQRVIGHVPYLNGGLFEHDPDGTDEDLAVIIPDKALGQILNDLFSRFNFTVTESTPLDVEVAVDPEMLGKVFEELVTGRHESGAYYTPKPIVSFMGREALKGYLETKLPKESADAIAAFVDDHKAGGLKDPERVLEALKKVTICDPACGSGAYLLGMLHELLDLRACLFASVKLDAPDVYDRKLEIIQNNLYGVDIEQFAINIARLRLWLSLAVDFNGDVAHLPPLPNLDFKIERGDSVCGPDPSGGLQLSLHQQNTLSDFLDKKEAYLKAHHEEKKQLWKEIQKIRATLKVAANTEGKEPGFLWAVEFAEIFTNGGFDVVLANPPYVRHELISAMKPALAVAHPELYGNTSDLYVYFYGRAMQLLRPGGYFVFISSNKWFRAAYGSKLRNRLASHCAIQYVIDFGHLPLFKSATAYPMIFAARKGSVGEQSAVYAEVPSLDAPYPDVLAVVRRYGATLPANAILRDNWQLLRGNSASRLNKMRERSTPLGEYLPDHLFFGIKTCLNDAYVLDRAQYSEMTRTDPKCKSVIKPLALGRDCEKWFVTAQDRWLILAAIGSDANRFGPIRAHFEKWKAGLKARADRGNEWWELRSCDYYDVFERPKIMWGNLSLKPCFSFSRSALYAIAPANVLATDDLFVLGLLNSTPAMHFFADISIQRNGKYLEFKPMYVKQFPIPNATASDQKAIRILAEKCINAKGVGCEGWEKEIDERVAALYGL